MSTQSSFEQKSPDSIPDTEHLDNADDQDTLEVAKGTDEDTSAELGTIDDLPQPSVASSLGSPTTELIGTNRDEDVAETHTEAILQSKQQDEPGIQDDNLEESLQKLSWTELQERFVHEMDSKCEDEQVTLALLNRLIKYYTVWAQASATQEQERAAKRLRTRIAYVQNKERELDNKQLHHTNVVQAFENALQLLRGTGV